ncbi:hypothetical protein BJV74DRAFT_529693 [Russula compacta]|nr:hypothetical protein BJV74DRAFT_529693 [Russula compacta]
MSKTGHVGKTDIRDQRRPNQYSMQAQVRVGCGCHGDIFVRGFALTHGGEGHRRRTVMQVRTDGVLFAPTRPMAAVGHPSHRYSDEDIITRCVVDVDRRGGVWNFAKITLGVKYNRVDLWLIPALWITVPVQQHRHQPSDAAQREHGAESAAQVAEHVQPK